jgi:hypothetical protein
VLLLANASTGNAQSPGAVSTQLICGDSTLLSGSGPSGETLLPLTDKVVVSVAESWRDSVDKPTFLLTFTTVQRYGGLIDLHGLLFHQRDSLTYRALGILSPSFGPSMIGPASGQCVIPLTRGNTFLTTTVLGTQDHYRLQLTDSTLLIRTLGTARSTLLGDSTRWRMPTSSFFFECAADELRSPWCQATRRVIASTAGLVEHAVPDSSYSLPFGEASSRRLYYSPAHGATFERVLKAMGTLGWRRDRSCDDLYVQIGTTQGALYQFYGCRKDILSATPPN